MKYKIEIIKNGDIYQLSSETLYLECSKMELISKLDEIEKSIVEKKQSLLLRLLRSVNMYGFFIKGLFLYFLVMSLIFTFSKEKKELVKNVKEEFIIKIDDEINVTSEKKAQRIKRLNDFMEKIRPYAKEVKSYVISL